MQNVVVKYKHNLLFIVVLPAVTILAVWFFHRRAVFSKDIRNVLLISLDTCRADYLSCYGYPRKTTSNIDAVAKEGILFENVISPVPITLPAHSSMMTGTIPPFHGIHDNFNYCLGDFNVTLAEILKENEFMTGAIIGSFVLNSRFGLDQGFITYDDDFDEEIKKTVISERLGQEVSRHASQWLEKHRDDQFFLFLHYFDPHVPYNPPEPFKSDYMLRPYVGEIAYVDHCIGQVIDKLKSLGLYDSTLIIITGDHGEALGGHREVTHAYFIYNEVIKVPLIFKVPGKYRANRIDDAVSLVDILPTVCRLLGVELPSEVHGTDLSIYFNDAKTATDTRYLFCESMAPTKYNGSSLLGVVSDGFKYIQTTRPELYNLNEDPEETVNLVEKRPHRVRVLQNRLKQILEQTVTKNKFDSKIDLGPDSIKRLESLGYVVGNISEDFSFDQSKDDPKDLIDYHILTTTVAALIRKEQYDEAQKRCQELISRRPDVYLPYFRLGEIASRQEDWARAIVHFNDAIKLEPDDFTLYFHRGLALFKQEKLDEASEQFKKSLQLYPEYVRAHTELGSINYRQNNPEQAIVHWTESVRLNPEQSNILSDLAELFYTQGKIHEAIKHWKESLKVEPDLSKALNNLAWVLATHKDEEIRDPIEAVRLAKKVCELNNFENAESLDTLSAAYAAAGRFEEAIQTAKKAEEIFLSGGMEKKAEQIRNRLELYETGKTYRE